MGFTVKSLDTAAPNLSGSVIGKTVAPSCDGRSDWSTSIRLSDLCLEVCLSSVSELDRDRDRDECRENTAEKRETRDSSAPTLDALLELPRGCFLISRRGLFLDML